MTFHRADLSVGYDMDRQNQGFSNRARDDGGRANAYVSGDVNDGRVVGVYGSARSDLKPTFPSCQLPNRNHIQTNLSLLFIPYLLSANHLQHCLSRPSCVPSWRINSSGGL